MRVRNLIAKPSTFNGNPLLKTRWKTVYKDGDGCGFVVNNGTNPKTDGSDIKTGFDILANSDIDVNQSEEKSAWITALPDCTLCFMLNVTALVEMTATMAVSYQSNNYWRTKSSTRQMNASQSETLAGMVQHVVGQRNACMLTAVNSVDSNTDIMRVSDITIVTGEEKTIMDYLGVGAFSALTAPYALSAGGGVFLLALVILSGGWSHENREPVAGPALREESRYVEQHARSRHLHTGRLILEMYPAQGLGAHPEKSGGLHDDEAQPIQLIGLLQSGAGDRAAQGGWDDRHGHHAGSEPGHRRRFGEGGCRNHGDGYVRRQPGRMADPPGDGNAHPRRRQRTLLMGLGVAA